MLLFVSLYFLTSAALNLYVLRWLKPAFGWHATGAVVFALCALAAMALPLLHRALAFRGHAAVALATGLVAYGWMMLVMWVVCFGLVADLWNALVPVLTQIFHPQRTCALSARTVVTALGALSVVLTVWGLVEARALRVATVPVQTLRFPAGTPPLRLLHISDLHLGPLVGARQTERILCLARDARPDILVCTGDLFESDDHEAEAMAREFRLLQAPLGKFAVLGNHEYYAGLDTSLRLLHSAGFQVLRAESVPVLHAGAALIIAGVDDPAGPRLGLPSNCNEDACLPPGAARPLTIFLKHRPRVRPESLGRFDLQLSGHTHGGQLFPFQAFVWLVYGRLAGLQALPGGAHLYISPGAGTWGPPLRVLARPALTLFVISPSPGPLAAQNP